MPQSHIDHSFLGRSILRCPFHGVRIELATGRRLAWLELTPGDPAGVFVVDRVNLSADGTAYVYSTRRRLSSVAPMTGLED